MIIEQPSQLLRLLFPGAIWRMDKEEKAVYLTFDDGPIPEMTPWILDILDRYDVKATFFMVGDNIRKHPEEFKMVKERGHRLGNHTFNHLKGFGHTTEEYIANVEKANEYLHTNLFRPPHGHMLWPSFFRLKKDYKIIMWDLVTRDYSKWMDGPRVLKNVKRYTRNGSIITFHDSLKSKGKIEYALPKAIEWLKAQGYEFKLL